VDTRSIAASRFLSHFGLTLNPIGWIDRYGQEAVGVVAVSRVVLLTHTVLQLYMHKFMYI